MKRNMGTSKSGEVLFSAGESVVACVRVCVVACVYVGVQVGVRVHACGMCASGCDVGVERCGVGGWPHGWRPQAGAVRGRRWRRVG